MKLSQKKKLGGAIYGSGRQWTYKQNPNKHQASHKPPYTSLATPLLQVMQVFFMDIPNPQTIPSSLKTSNLQKPSNSSSFYWFFTAALSQKTKKHNLIMKILPLSQQPSKSQTFKFLEFL